MATEFNYTREWTDAEAFPLLSFTKNWENPEDYPTYEPDEMQVRRDMQSLHDEVKDFLNNDLIPRVVAEDATVDAWNAMERARQEAETSRVNAETARAAAESARATAESQRVQTESNRVSAEQARVTAEASRVSTEQARVSVEDKRAAAEILRAEDEVTRRTAEQARNTAEKSRADSEIKRASAEQNRDSAETGRTQAEQARVTAEQARVAAEQNRATKENSRTQAENARASSEATRVTQESARVAAENARVAAEKQRVNAESARVNAEQARENQETGYVAQAKAYAESAAKSAQEAKDATDFATRPEAQGYADTAESNANKYTDQRIAAIPTPDVSGQINTHNTSISAHSDIRSLANNALSVANSKVAKTDIVQDIGAATDKVMSQKAVTDKFNGYVIPDYWQAYLNGKISDIKGLQDAGGKDCFSFVVMTDLHYPSNLGKRSPDLARKIVEEINAKYVFCLGDVQTRGCWHTKKEVLDELAEVEAFFAPIKDRLLRTQGNHDGSYGWLDRDGDGQYTNTGKEPADRETYVNNLTPAEIFERIYRPNGMVGDIHTDESGTGYYIDDTANKVRYIVLNTQKNDYELQEDGTQKYPNMWLFRFTQSQFDFLANEALVDGLTDAWNVVVLGHCPLYQEIGDREVMQGVLNAYKNKATYTGEYAGTADSEAVVVPEYTNLAEPLPDNTTDTTKWVNGYRFSSTAISAQAGTTLSNVIECTNGDVIRIKGVTLRSNADRFAVNKSADSTGGTSDSYGYYNSPATIGGNAMWSFDGLTDGVYKFTIGSGAFTVHSLRFAMPTPEDASAVIITVNEEIKETVVSADGYDSVSVDVDFSNAKGNLVGYFAGHVHVDNNTVTGGVPVITTRCDAKEENTDALKTERVAGTTTEQSFDVFTVNTKTKKIHATKIGAGNDRTISY